MPDAALAIAVPLAMRTAVRHDINLMLMGIITIEGALAGGFSPISVWGQLVSTVTGQAGQPISGPILFGIEFGLNLVVAIVAFLIFGGLRLARRQRDVVTHAGSEQPDGGRRSGTTRELSGWSPEVGGDVSAGGASQAVTAGVAAQTAVAAQPKPVRMGVYELTSLLATAAFIVVVLVFNSDVGLTAFAAGLVLQVIFRPDEKTVIRALPWSVVLVISGVLLYVGLLDQLGTLDAIAGHLQNISSVSVAILAISFVGSLFASFESSSVAVLGLVVPLALQVVPGVTGVELLLVLSAVCWSIVVVSASPYHLSGGLVLANSAEHEQTRLFRRLLLWSLAVAVAIPAVGSLLPIAMGVR